MSGEPHGCDQNERKDEVEALRLEYEYVRKENLRLRDGRASITRQLGPLPIGAAVVAGLVTGFTTEARENVSLWLALVVFFVLVLVSILYSSMKPYRGLRRQKEAEASSRLRSTSSPQEWYKAAITLEKAVYGPPNCDTGIRRHSPALGIRRLRRQWRAVDKVFPDDITGLQDGYDRERSGLFIVQVLFAIVIVLLISSRIV